MSFIHIPKTQLQQMFRTSRGDYSTEQVGNMSNVSYIATNGPAGWQYHSSWTTQIVSPMLFSGLRLYKGIIPTISEIDNLLYIDTVPYGSGLNGLAGGRDYWSFRTSDILVKLDINATGSGTLNANGELPVNFLAGIASQTGTASWFCFRTMPYSDQTNFGVNQAYTIFGTIGAPGSGADLELLSTSVTSGQAVRLGSIKFPMPSKCAW